jgi:hypothetical protein
LRRAAHWDGWLADGADPKGVRLSPDDVARSIATIDRSDSYDVAVLAESDRMDAGAYARAGATWWLENLHDKRGSTAEMLALVQQGPPR